MKIKTTTKNIRYLDPIAFGYCEIQDFERFFWDPLYYTAWIYGWKQDTYKVGSYYISTGYSPVWKHINYDLLKKYRIKLEKLLKKLDQKWIHNYYDKQPKVIKLFIELLEKNSQLD